MVASGRGEERFGEEALPFFALVGVDAVEREVVTSGWDVNSVAHRFAADRGELVVGVDRRATAQERPGSRRVPISDQRARESVATVLAAQVPEAAADLYTVAAELAGAGGEWRQCRMEIDGERFDAYEREYEGRRVRYCLTPALIVFVVGPEALRPEPVVLRPLAPEELERTHGEGDQPH